MPDSTLRVSIDASGARRGAREYDRETERMKRSTGELDREIGRTQRGIGGLGTALAAGAVAVGVFAVAFSGLNSLVRQSVTLYGQQERAQKQIEAALISTGGAAGVTASELFDLAASLQRVTVFADETILEMQGVLLTFTEIGATVLPQATEAVLNIATRMGQDLNSAAIQVGKALNDPIRGLDGLSRSGIQFTDSQKEVIKALAESGRVAEAQKLILAELENQFGGSARAAREGVGAFAALNNQIGDLFEVAGQQLAPSLGLVAEELLKIAESEEATEAITELAVAVSDLVVQLAPLAGPTATKVVEGLDSIALSIDVLRTNWLALFDALQSRDIIGFFDRLAIATNRSVTSREWAANLRASNKALEDLAKIRAGDLGAISEGLAGLPEPVRRLAQVTPPAADGVKAFNAELVGLRNEVELLRGTRDMLFELEQGIHNLRLEAERRAASRGPLLDESVFEDLVTGAVAAGFDPNDPAIQGALHSMGAEYETVLADATAAAAEKAKREFADRLASEVGRQLATSIAGAVAAGAIGGQQGSQTEAVAISLFAIAGAAFGGAAGAAIGQAVGEAIFDKSRPGAFDISNVGAVSLDILEGNLRASLDSIGATLEDAFASILGSIEGFATQLGPVSIAIRNDGEKFRLNLGAEVVGIFDTMEQAITAGLKAVLAAGEFSGVADEVLQVFRTSSAHTVQALQEQVNVAQRIADLRLGVGDTGRAIRELSQDLRALTGVAREAGLETGLLVDDFLSSLRDLRRDITGQQLDPFALFLEESGDFNESLARYRESLQRELMELQRSLELAQQAIGPGLAGAAEGIRRGTNQLIDSIPGLRERIAEIIAILAGLPIDISPQEFAPRGGGRGAQRRADQERLGDILDRFARANLPEVERAIAEINARWAEHAELAHGNAELLERVADARQQELDALHASLREGVFAQLAAFEPMAEMQRQLLAIETERADIQQRLNDLFAAGIISSKELADATERLTLAERQRRDELRADVINEADQLIVRMLEAAGRTEEAAELRWRLEVEAYRLQIQRLAAEFELLGITTGLLNATGPNGESFQGTLLRLEELLAVIIAGGPPVPGAGVGGITPGGGGGFNTAQAEMESALATLQHFLDLGLNPMDVAIRELNETFEELRRVLGNTAEVQQAYALGLQQIQEQYTSGLQEFLENLYGSTLSPEANLASLRQRFAELAATGDLSQSNELLQLAQQLQAAGQAGLGSGGFQELLGFIHSTISAFLGGGGIPLPAPGTGGGPIGLVPQEPPVIVPGPLGGVSAPQVGVITAVDRGTNILQRLETLTAAVERNTRRTAGEVSASREDAERRFRRRPSDTMDFAETA